MNKTEKIQLTVGLGLIVLGFICIITYNTNTFPFHSDKVEYVYQEKELPNQTIPEPKEIITSEKIQNPEEYNVELKYERKTNRELRAKATIASILFLLVGFPLSLWASLWASLEY